MLPYRCLFLIALCLAVASATYRNKNRFHKLLNRYQQTPWGNQNQELLGSDDLDDYIDDYVDQIRRERMCERDQCPRDLEDILSLDDEEFDKDDMEEYRYRKDRYEDNEYRYRQYPTEDNEEYRHRQYPKEDDEEYLTEDKEEYPYRQYPHEDMDQYRHRRFPTEGRQFEDDETGGLGYRRQFIDEEMEDTESGYRRQPRIRSPLLKEVHDANVKLTSRLYEQCKQEKDDKNIVVSPVSVQLALAILNSGARGETRRQIGRVIGGNLKTQERKQIFKTLVRHLKGYRNMDYRTSQHTTKINTVTGLFVSQRTPAQQMFIQKVKGVLGATVKHCSFSQQPQQCRRTINQWVSQKTHGKINQIVPQDAITDNTKMILVNALELRATWGRQLRHKVTKQAKFYPLDTKKVKIVDVLETEGHFKYYEDELVKIVGLPTKQEELTFYTIVPKDKDGLTDVEKLHLQDNVQLKDLLKKVDRRQRRVHVQLPKIQIKHKVDVRRTLRKQGVTDAFDSKRADFSGITGINKYREDDMEETYGQTLRRNPFLDIESGYGKFEQQGRYRRNPFYETEMEGGMYGKMGKRETKLHLNKFIHQCTIKITGKGITATTGTQTEETYEKYQGRVGGMESEEMGIFDEVTGFGLREPSGTNVVKANRAFAFVIKHNPTEQLIMVGRVIDAAQKKVNHLPLTINNVDQL